MLGLGESEAVRPMKTFIRVVELWVPDRTRTRLELEGKAKLLMERAA